MLLALSRPTNPNWQGLKAWGTSGSPVKQAFHITYQGTAGFSAGAEALPQASVFLPVLLSLILREQSSEKELRHV